MSPITGWAAQAPNQPLARQTFDPGPLGPEEVEIAVEHCGVCHSDLSAIQNEWGNTIYPIIAGHEAIGRVTALGEQAKGLTIGQHVGLGWTAQSCMHCGECLSGDQHLCLQARPTISGRTGAFAERVRAHWAWTIPLPAGIDRASAGPLLCGGVTVFSPLATYGIQGSQHVGVVGIGGLGHLAIKFARAWGCEVTAFTSSESKTAEAKAFGADHVINSRDEQAIASAANRFDLLLVTVNVSLNWPAYLGTLKPKGRMHVVGAVVEPMAIPVFALLSGQKSVSSSPTGSPTMIAAMLEFAARRKIAPQVEYFPMSKINDALAHLATGKARYRIVLNADF